MKNVRTVRPPWDLGLIAVCRSCDGYEKAFRRDLKEALAEAGLRGRVRIVASACLDVCPKGGTTVVAATTRGLAVSVVRSGKRDPAALRRILRDFTTAADRPISIDTEPPCD